MKEEVAVVLGYFANRRKTKKKSLMRQRRRQYICPINGDNSVHAAAASTAEITNK